MKKVILALLVTFTFANVAHAPTLPDARLDDHPQRYGHRDFCGQKIEYGGASEKKKIGEEGAGMDEQMSVFTNDEQMVTIHF